MTPTEFKTLFPEFSGATDAIVQTRLTWAEDRTDEELFGDMYDQGVGLMCAHFLCLLPQAKDLRKGEKPGETPYLRERLRLNMIVASGYRTAGLP